MLVNKHRIKFIYSFISCTIVSRQTVTYILHMWRQKGKVINNICKYFLFLISMSQTSIMIEPRTRHTSGSNLSDLIGRGKEFLTSELPTARDILQLGIFLKETHHIGSKYLVNEIITDIYVQLHAQWMKANHMLDFP